MMLPAKIEWWRKEIYSRIKYFLRKYLPKKKRLCTITFLYKMKGVIGSDRPKKETVFAWVENGTTTHDCVKLFSPAGVNISMCIVTDVIVIDIKTITHED